MDRAARAQAAARSQSLWDSAGTSRILRRAFSVNANSRWTKDDALARCPEAAVSDVVYYGVPARSLREKEVWPAGLELARPYILCTARLAEYKGLDVLLLAFAALIEEGRDIHLVLCGADHSGGGLMRFARSLGLEGRVRWLGQRPYAEARALLKESLFFVLPSRRESLGTAMIEALQAGKAVAATRVGGIPEIVRDGEEGLLVEPKDVGALAGAMRKLCDDADLRRRMGRSALRRSALFTWDRALDRYVQLYRAHPDRAGGKTAFVIWDSCADSTALSYAENVAAGLTERGWPFVLLLRRSSWAERFISRRSGRTLYRLGLPFSGGLDALAVLLQLFWIARAERIRLWHYLLLRYRDLGPLNWFARLARLRPIVTLS